MLSDVDHRERPNQYNIRFPVRGWIPVQVIRVVLPVQLQLPECQILQIRALPRVPIYAILC